MLCMVYVNALPLSFHPGLTFCSCSLLLIFSLLDINIANEKMFPLEIQEISTTSQRVLRFA